MTGRDARMTRNVRAIYASPDDVFEVLGDGWLFAGWVVGASRMRSVDAGWPEVGSRLHHSFGVWPFVIDDETTVLEYDPPRLLRIRPQGWPLGEAEVLMEVTPRGTGCVVRMSERAVAGPGSWIPAPLLEIPLRIRNAEALRRLAYMAEARRDRREQSP